MTNEEAIKVLEENSCYCCSWMAESPVKCTCPKCILIDALKMAIEALKEKRPHGELREEVLSMICKVNDYYGYTDSMHMFKVLFDQKYHGWVKEEGDKK